MVEPKRAGEHGLGRPHNPSDGGSNPPRPITTRDGRKSAFLVRGPGSNWWRSTSVLEGAAPSPRASRTPMLDGERGGNEAAQPHMRIRKPVSGGPALSGPANEILVDAPQRGVFAEKARAPGHLIPIQPRPAQGCQRRMAHRVAAEPAQERTNLARANLISATV